MRACNGFNRPRVGAVVSATQAGWGFLSVRIGVERAPQQNGWEIVRPREDTRIFRRSRMASPVKRLGRSLVLIAIGVLTLDQLALQGLMTPIVVTSGSMFPTLRGPHWKSHCPRCGRELLWDAAWGEKRTTLIRAVCPGCGKRWAEVQPGESAKAPPVSQHSGDRILVFRGLVRPVQRWDLAAIREQSIPGLVVKRVVGLPGEKVFVKAGLLYCNEVPMRRPLPVQWEMARLLTRCGNEDGQGLVLSADGVDKKSAEWAYSRRLTTFCPYHPAADQAERLCANVLWSVCVAHGEPESVFTMSAKFGDCGIEVTWSAGEHPSVAWRILAQEKPPLFQGRQELQGTLPRRIVLSSVDRRWMLLMDDTCLFTHDWDDDGSPKDAPVVLRLTVARGEIRLQEMGVWWVVPYPDGLVADAGDGFVLLGDDPHISLDSRQGGRRWRREDIVGVVRPLCLVSGRWSP